MSELRAQLGKMGGESGTSAAPSSETDASLYPAIRQLPLLGVTYADLYRQTKIQETVYELLTQQYELAKVEEAKEVPSVKVLDAAVVPTKKSFPPRATVDGSGHGVCDCGSCARGFLSGKPGGKSIRRIRENNLRPKLRERFARMLCAWPRQQQSLRKRWQE